MKYQPINGRILVKPLEAEEKTASGIYIPDNARGKTQEGEVAALAKDATDEIAVGDRVIFKEYSGTEVKIDGEKYILFVEDDILAKYEAADEIPE